MTKLWIDNRYAGAHGIARYASEVVSRLNLPWSGLPVTGKPASPRDLSRRLSGIPRGDLVYSPGYAAFPSNRKQVLTVHDLIHLEVPWPRRAKYLAYYNGVVRPAIGRAGLVFTVSESATRSLSRWLADDSVAVINTGNACSASFTSDGAAHQSPMPYILFVGNMRKHKNADVAVSLLSRLDGFVLRMLVPASEVPRARALAEAKGVPHRVHIMSGLTDQELAEEYRGAVATVVPSSLEGFGLPALESVCCGTPVVYWSGCEAVAEASLGRGHAVQDLRDATAWANAVLQLSIIPPPPHPPVAPTWESVARTVQDHLEQELGVFPSSRHGSERIGRGGH